MQNETNRPEIIYNMGKSLQIPGHHTLVQHLIPDVFPLCCYDNLLLSLRRLSSRFRSMAVEIGVHSATRDLSLTLDEEIWITVNTPVHPRCVQ